MGKTFMSYFGGKSKFDDFIVPVIPKNINRYVEPFAGSFAIYFLADFNDDVEIVFNDLNRDQANIFECSKNYNKYLERIKFHLEDPNGDLFCKETDKELRKQFYKELYYTYKKSDFSNQKFNIPDYDRAAVYAYLSTSAFNSCHFTAAGFSGFNKDRMKYLTFIKKLENKELQEKFESINIVETLGFKELIEKYDSEDTFMYLDPPYYEKKDKRSGWYGTKDEFGQEEHVELLKLLRTTKCKWALSYYYFPILEEYLPKDQYVWLERDFFRSSASFSDNKETKGTELLILNYNPGDVINNKGPKIKTEPKRENPKIENIDVEFKVEEEIDDFWNS
jgi:DNA adenine methylase